MFSSLWPKQPPADRPQDLPQTKSSDHIPEELMKDAKEELERVKQRFDSLPVPVVALVAFGLGLACSTSGALLYARYGRRIKNTDWITPGYFEKNRWIRGVVTSVGDADNFRFFHTPSFGGWRWPFKFRQIPTSNKELVNQTLHVRIAGVDAPEHAHFGKPEQPYAKESLAWLRQKILGKVVYCQLIRRDQYHRVVSNVHLAPRLFPGAFFFGKNLAVEMLRAGCATTYEQAGAEYGKQGKEEYLRVEKEARAARRGMWAKGMTTETPAEYKRRHSSALAEPIITEKIQRKARAQKPNAGWFSRLFR